MNSVFAKRLLEKQGWEEGDGLGRKRDGMSEPIKVNLKMDKTGVGHDPGKEFTDHWWMRAFNDAAAKKVKTGNKQPECDNDEDSEERSKKEERRKLFYKGFVKGSTLTNGLEEKGSEDESSEDEQGEDVVMTGVPSLDDLHKFCGGATGHKAARLGMKMSGKLLRIAAHDKSFEERLKVEPEIFLLNEPKEGVNTEMPTEEVEIVEKSERKKKKKQRKEKDESMRIEENGLNLNGKTEVDEEPQAERTSDVEPPRKKKKKSKSSKGESILKSHDNVEISPDVIDVKVIDLPVQEEQVCEETARKNKKKRKREKDVAEKTDNHELITSSKKQVEEECYEKKSSDEDRPKKKKKSKKGLEVEENIPIAHDEQGDTSQDVNIKDNIKKKKKKKKNKADD